MLRLQVGGRNIAMGTCGVPMRRDNLDDLFAFVSVARERSLTRAAARPGVSQSAPRSWALSWRLHQARKPRAPAGGYLD
ncbi:MAG: helix-turn-helix domain-containing protein [Nevskiaceae bacterium]